MCSLYVLHLQLLLLFNISILAVFVFIFPVYKCVLLSLLLYLFFGVYSTVSILIDFICTVNSIHPKKGYSAAVAAAAVCLHKVLWPQILFFFRILLKTKRPKNQRHRMRNEHMIPDLTMILNCSVCLIPFQPSTYCCCFPFEMARALIFQLCRRKIIDIHLFNYCSEKTETLLFVIDLPFHLNSISAVNWTKDWKRETILLKTKKHFECESNRLNSWFSLTVSVASRAFQYVWFDSFVDQCFVFGVKEYELKTEI